jgi:polyisoprenoid-binding protein YceI
VLKCYGAAILALLLTACGAPKPRQAAPPAELVPAKPPSVAGRVYHIDPAQSELRVLVYKSGPMASLGHNHVIVNRELTGWVKYLGLASAASFSVTVPVAGFVVDESQMRREEGADFPGEIPDDAKSGTLKNLLGPAVLDAGQFPAISVRSVNVTDAHGALQATLALSVAGHESTLIVPFTLVNSPERLTASGALTVRQSALGITPFSIFLGALRVQDEMRLKFKFVAVADGAPSLR